MIKFTDKENNKQFISIEPKYNTSTEIISDNLKKIYESLQKANIIFYDSEIIIEIDNNHRFWIFTQ